MGPTVKNVASTVEFHTDVTWKQGSVREGAKWGEKESNAIYV